jgi:hypothetical protein
VKLPSKAEIEAGKSARGGWTRARLAEWGVPWPPPKGWKKALIAKGKASPWLCDGAARSSAKVWWGR